MPDDVSCILKRKPGRIVVNGPQDLHSTGLQNLVLGEAFQLNETEAAGKKYYIRTVKRRLMESVGLPLVLRKAAPTPAFM